MAKICPTCGGESPDNANFCVKCGIPHEQLKQSEIAEPVETAEAKTEQNIGAEAEGALVSDEAAIEYQEQKAIADIELAEAAAEEQVNEAEKAQAAGLESVQDTIPESEADSITVPLEQPVNEDNEDKQEYNVKEDSIEELFAEDPYGEETPPPKNSRYSPMTSVGTALSIIALNIPVIGFILAIIWASGGCRKIGRRNLARAELILIVVGIIVAIIVALLVRFAFADTITQYFESIYPGYTIIWE